jgi:hypothetical protein
MANKRPHSHEVRPDEDLIIIFTPRHQHKKFPCDQHDEETVLTCKQRSVLVMLRFQTAPATPFFFFCSFQPRAGKKFIRKSCEGDSGGRKEHSDRITKL